MAGFGSSPFGGAPFGGGSGPTQHQQSLSASLTLGGSLLRRISHALSAAQTFGGSLARLVPHSLSGALGSAGSLSHALRYSRVLTGSVGFAAQLGASARHVLNLSATLGLTGVAARVRAEVMTGVLSFSTSSKRLTGNRSAAALSVTTGQVRAIQRGLASGLSASGGLVKGHFVSLGNSALAVSAALKALHGRSFTSSLSLTSSQWSKQAVKHFQASLAPSGTFSFAARILRQLVLFLSQLTGSKQLVTDAQTVEVGILSYELRDGSVAYAVEVPTEALAFAVTPNASEGYVIETSDDALTVVLPTLAPVITTPSGTETLAP